MNATLTTRNLRSRRFWRSMDSRFELSALAAQTGIVVIPEPGDWRCFPYGAVAHLPQVQGRPARTMQAGGDL